MEPLKPKFDPNDFKTAAAEVLVGVPLAFREGSHLRDDVLSELSVD